MTLESMAINTTRDAAQKSLRAVDSAVKKAWTILDAASEKKPPSEYLSKQAVSAIQGKTGG